jgi:hypothetical protein
MDCRQVPGGTERSRICIPTKGRPMVLAGDSDLYLTPRNPLQSMQTDGLSLPEHGHLIVVQPMEVLSRRRSVSIFLECPSPCPCAVYSSKTSCQSVIRDHGMPPSRNVRTITRNIAFWKVPGSTGEGSKPTCYCAQGQWIPRVVEGAIFCAASELSRVTFRHDACDTHLEFRSLSIFYLTANPRYRLFRVPVPVPKAVPDCTTISPSHIKCQCQYVMYDSRCFWAEPSREFQRLSRQLGKSAPLALS